MPNYIIMPDLGTVSDKIKLIEWLVNEGDGVVVGQPFFKAESDKAIMEVESSATGKVGKLVVTPETNVKIGEIVAIVLNPGESIDDIQPVRPQANMTKPLLQDHIAGEIDTNLASLEKSHGIEITPKALYFSREKNININTIIGTGPQGRITYADVEKASRLNQKDSDLQGSRENDKIDKEDALLASLKGLRGVIASKMAYSIHTAATVTVTSEVRVDQLIELRTKLRSELKEQELSLPYDLFIAKICAKALNEFPYINSSLGKSGIIIHNEVNIGIAVDIPDGLLVPVLVNVDNRDLIELARDFQGKVERAKAGCATLEDLKGGTFTITNVGMYSIDAFTPIINLPECAILGIGRIIEKPVAQNGKLGVGNTMVLSLSYDHRIVDGGPVGRFMDRVCELIENPLDLFYQDYPRS